MKELKVLNEQEVLGFWKDDLPQTYHPDGKRIHPELIPGGRLREEKTC